MKKTAGTFVFCLLAAVLCVCLFSGAGAETVAPTEPPVIDLDLSRMSGTVVYAQIYNLMYDPEPWLGKIISMTGFYNYYDDQEHGIVYHACIVPDATACCSQGIEFVWAGEHHWPEDYPEGGADITVTGRLEIYEENGYNYLHLVDAELLTGPGQEAQP